MGFKPTACSTLIMLQITKKANQYRFPSKGSFFFSIRYQLFMANFSEKAICLKGGILFGFQFFYKKRLGGTSPLHS